MPYEATGMTDCPLKLVKAALNTRNAALDEAAAIRHKDRDKLREVGDEYRKKETVVGAERQTCEVRIDNLQKEMDKLERRAESLEQQAFDCMESIDAIIDGAGAYADQLRRMVIIDQYEGQADAHTKAASKAYRLAEGYDKEATTYDAQADGHTAEAKRMVELAGTTEYGHRRANYSADATLKERLAASYKQDAAEMRRRADQARADASHHRKHATQYTEQAVAAQRG